MERPIAVVAVPRHVERAFDYRIPEALDEAAVPGARVRVPFGSEQLVGYLLERKAKSDYTGKLQPVLAVLDEEPVLSPELLALARWISTYYLCPLGLALQAMAPAGLRRAAPSRQRLVQLAQNLNRTLDAIEHLTPSAPQQARLLRALLGFATAPTAQELLARTGCSQGPLRALAAKGLIRLVPLTSKAGAGEPGKGFGEPAKRVRLTPAQEEALEAIQSGLNLNRSPSASKGLLVHGVNGSGKTEVYLRAVASALEAGKTAIVVVPEIARFRHRLGDRLAVWHSGMSEAQRARERERLQAGEARVVVGVRAAIFAPLEELGLIVIDEEHEPTYKQDDPAPRYHVREVAFQRADREGAVVVLGSATPSLESYYAAERGRLRLLKLPQRVVGGGPPEVEVVDMAQEKGIGILSDRLRRALRECLASHRQALLLLNRRGYGAAHCRECGRTQRCPRCRIALVFHLKPAQLRCHYCGLSWRRNVCRSCGSKELTLFGAGTQRAEEALRRCFPSARIRRMDSDAVRRGEHTAILEAFRRGETDILLGTQMVGLGHDFPNVTLAAVLDADTLMDLPDFRAAERTFQLVSQAVGRAGRGAQPAKVIIQTRHPDHPLLRHAARQDYPSFYREELRYREALQYPPVSCLIQAVVERRAEERAQSEAQALYEDLRRCQGGRFEVLGPSPRVPYRRRGRAGWQLLLKVPKSEKEQVQEELKGRIAARRLEQAVRLDVDPRLA